MKNLSLIEAINTRQSVKGFDPNVKIPHETMEEMIQLATKAPSSINLQPWRFVIVESVEAKAAIKDLVRFNTHQLETSAAFILVLSDNHHTQDVEKIMKKNVELGYMPKEVEEQNTAIIKQLVSSAPESYFVQQGIMDANLAAMQLMLVAKEYGYDTNPIGGFERQEVMEALNIDSNRYVPVMFIAMGKGVKAPHDSSRHEVKEIISYDILNNGVIGE
ncbi:nitroreductase family protein [Macrococcoides caseolyticum]|uniref:nitroreductase family protein n=1 Tax=Macrococcoides caseolyticum TaxID=69966 RepID=UPI001F45474E|nr:nitroreductase family protein [Macrococcus caseolyticus]MCE4957920.1 nitroreductase family protein [Macrococcus caseolyticus]